MEAIVQIEGACPEVDRNSLSGLVCRVAKTSMVAVEIGSWQGLSTSAIAELVCPLEGHLYCVDHWLGSLAEPNELKAAREKDMFQIFKSNMTSLGYWERVHPLVMSSMDAVRIFRDETADMVFIDANHSYEEVLNDITGWLPKVKRGGIICGHDYDKGHSGVMRAVVELLKDFQVMPSCIWYKVRDI